MSNRRKTVASANVTAAGAYVNSDGFGTIAHPSAGRYDLPGTTEDFMPGGAPATYERVIYTQSVIAADSLPKVMTLLAITPGIVSVLITDLAGAPVDCAFTVGVDLVWPQ